MDSHIKGMIKNFQATVLKRSFETITKQQKNTVFDPPVKPSIWLSRVKLPAPEDENLRITLLKVVKELGRGDEDFTVPLPAFAEVEGHWVGSRDPPREEDDAVLTDRENYEGLMGSVKNKITLFYIHGGAFYFGHPGTTRPVMVALAGLTGGRCFGVKYRLAPQHAFPAAVLDVFLAYLSLLYPAPGAFHESVLPGNIVITGDSSGANLGLAVLQIIKELNLKGAKVAFQGKDVQVPFPAGYAGFSILGENTHCLPSYITNAPFDVLANPQPLLQPQFPSCPLWPTTPPRGDVYCEISAMCHPLISPTSNSSWDGFPPMWLAYGQEQMVDEGKIIAQQAAKQGVSVQWSEYSGMPHVFAFKFPMIPQAVHVFRSWAKFCRECVFKREVQEFAKAFEGEECKEQNLDVRNLLDVSYEELEKQMREKQAQRTVWTGTTSKKEKALL